MIVNPVGATGIDRILHHSGKDRSYDVTIIDGKVKRHNFQYTENNIEEYIIEGGLAISGSNSRHYFGIISNNNFYYGHFSKGNKTSRTKSSFWKYFHPKKNLHVPTQFDIEGKKQYTFTDPINLCFSLNAYWHWFNEDLPLFRYLRTNDFQILTNKLTDWQLESIEYFPDIKKRIVQLDTPCVIKSPRFHAFTKPDNGGGRNAKWTTEFLKDNFKAKAGAPVKKIYISRNADAEARGVDNEAQVKDFLRPLGFEFYDKFSALTLQEKVDLLHSCEVVISATGANLTHVYAMQPRTTVIDFNHKFLLETEYWYNNVGDTAGLNWVTCGMPTGSPTKRPKLKNNNLIVSIETLEQAISLCNLK